MAKVIQRVELALRSFYIFNSSFGRKEGEESKKILFYYPEDIELNTKIKDVGLSEAIIAFTGTFTSDDDCESLHTQKTSQIFYQPEKGYWMVLVINVPKEIRLKDGVEYPDYKVGEVHDRIYREALKQSYNMFRLFAGTFEMNLGKSEATNEDPREHLMKQFDLFYSKYLLTLKLPTCNVFDALNSLQYLPLDKFLFLRVHNFINMIKAAFSPIVETIFLYNEQVLCSNINPTDLYCIHEYLTSTIFPKTNHSELSGGSLTRSSITSSEYYRNGGFVTGPEDLQASTRPPIIYILVNGKLKCYYLIIYRAMNATLCLLVDGNEDLQDAFYAQLHSFMGPQLANIASDIGESLTKSASSLQTAKSITSSTAADSDLSSPKYLFINQQSLKHISNIYIDKHRPKASSIPLNVMNLIADLNNSFDNNNENSTEEIQVKTTNDYWIVKKTCNWRQFYVIFCNSKATLLDIASEARKVFEQEITDDVFFDK